MSDDDFVTPRAASTPTEAPYDQEAELAPEVTPEAPEAAPEVPLDRW